jgi:hypothetical protein
MKDPRRLLDGDGSEEQRALLRAAALEEPAPDGRARLLGALGVTAPSVVEAPAPAQSTAPGGLTAASSAASATKLAVLALGGAAILGAGALLWSRSETPARRDAPPAHSAGASALPTGDQAVQAAEPTGSVAREIEAIERVRSERGRKDGQAALTALRRYASEHPRGVLAHEADVLRVEALLQAGDAPAALELAQQLLARHGESPHRARLEALARQANAPSAP